jgi:hypothetical protein
MRSAPLRKSHYAASNSTAQDSLDYIPYASCGWRIVKRQHCRHQYQKNKNQSGTGRRCNDNSGFWGYFSDCVQHPPRGRAGGVWSIRVDNLNLLATLHTLLLL